jgi:hypothetical protein
MKTEVLWYGSATNLSKLSPGFMLIPIGPGTLHQVRDLGVYFDAQLNMKVHIRRVAGACHCHLRRLRARRGLLDQEVTARLVSAFVLSRLDYCNAILIGLPASTLAPLQRVMYDAARLVCDLKPHDHISASICVLLWLPIKQRIDLNSVSSCIRPSMEELHRTYRTSSRSLCQFLDVQHFVPPLIMILFCSHRIVNLAIVHFQWLVLVRGTLSRLN